MGLGSDVCYETGVGEAYGKRKISILSFYGLRKSIC